MSKARVGLGLVAGCLLAWGGALPASAAEVADVLRIRPKQEGIVYSTPSAEEAARCKLTLEDNKTAFVLRDGEGKLLRRFVDTKGDGHLHLWSYYRNGVEVYREIDTNADRRPDEYRWFNAAGMKWGVDVNQDGKIDSWKWLAVEEAAQEIVQALAQHDLARLQALMLTDAEIQALDLPATEAARIRDLRAKAPAKFEATRAKVSQFSDKTHVLHVETEAPLCIPTEQTGSKYDLIKHANVAIICETAGKTDWLQTGELIKIGMAWRIVDAPTEGAPRPDDEAVAVDKDVQALLDQLTQLDAKQPSSGTLPGAREDLVRYHLARVELLGKIVQGKVKAEEREQRIREMADSLSAAAQSSQGKDTTAFDKLGQLETQIMQMAPGSNLAAYVTFREMQADYAKKLGTNNVDQVQKEWLARLAKFVQAYPHSDDTPEALLQLGMVSEFMGQEIQAKNWYQQLVRDFPGKLAAIKAEGAIRRFDVEGKPLQLTAPELMTGASFDVSRLQGKLVVVYYWASWNQQCLGDFAKLKLILDEFGGKGVQLVCVNLDSNAEEARKFLQLSPAPGTHLFLADGQATGLDSPLATQYGILVLPNTFLVGKDGKVLSRSVQVNNLTEELRNRTK